MAALTDLERQRLQELAARHGLAGSRHYSQAEVQVAVVLACLLGALSGALMVGGAWLLRWWLF